MKRSMWISILLVLTVISGCNAQSFNCSGSLQTPITGALGKSICKLFSWCNLALGASLGTSDTVFFNMIKQMNESGILPYPLLYIESPMSYTVCDSNITWVAMQEFANALTIASPAVNPCTQGQNFYPPDQSCFTDGRPTPGYNNAVVEVTLVIIAIETFIGILIAIFWLYQKERKSREVDKIKGG